MISWGLLATMEALTPLSLRRCSGLGGVLPVEEAVHVWKEDAVVKLGHGVAGGFAELIMLIECISGNSWLKDKVRFESEGNWR